MSAKLFPVAVFRTKAMSLDDLIENPKHGQVGWVSVFGEAQERLFHAKGWSGCWVTVDEYHRLEKIRKEAKMKYLLSGGHRREDEYESHMREVYASV